MGWKLSPPTHLFTGWCRVYPDRPNFRTEHCRTVCQARKTYGCPMASGRSPLRAILRTSRPATWGRMKMRGRDGGTQWYTAVPYTMFSAWMIYKKFSNLYISRALGISERSCRTTVQRWRNGRRILPVYSRIIRAFWPETSAFLRVDGHQKRYVAPVTYRPPSKFVRSPTAGHTHSPPR